MRHNENVSSQNVNLKEGTWRRQKQKRKHFNVFFQITWCSWHRYEENWHDMKGTTSVFSERSKKKDRISSTYLNDSGLWPSICSSNVLYYKAIKASYFFYSRCINHEHISFKSFRWWIFLFCKVDRYDNTHHLLSETIIIYSRKHKWEKRFNFNRLVVFLSSRFTFLFSQLPCLDLFGSTSVCWCP